MVPNVAARIPFLKGGGLFASGSIASPNLKVASSATGRVVMISTADGISA